MIEGPVFVTGAAGWLGTRLVMNLISGMKHPALSAPVSPENIFCLARDEGEKIAIGKIDSKINIVVGDLTSKESVQNFLKNGRGGVLFQLAGVIHPTRGTREFEQVNVEGVKNILESAEEAGLRRVVVMSSNSPIGCNPHQDHLFDEESPYNPYMGYGKSKMKMEKVVSEIEKRGKIETVTIRGPWFYGPNQPPRQSLFFKMIRTGKVPVVGSGENRRSMVYLDNLCQGLLLAALKEGVSGQIYWIADEAPYSMNEIVSTVKSVLDQDFGLTVSPKVMKLPGFMAEIALLVDRFLQFIGLYHQKIHVLSEMNKNIACSVKKAKNQLDYQPEVSLREGMKRSIKWCLDNGHEI